VAFVAAAFTLSPQAVRAEDGFVPSNSAEDTWQTILPFENFRSVLGKEVRNGAGENLGRIVDVLIDQGGQVRAVAIDFGGFLGVGARRLVVDSTALHLGTDTITAVLSRIGWRRPRFIPLLGQYSLRGQCKSCRHKGHGENETPGPLDNPVARLIRLLTASGNDQERCAEEATENNDP